MSTSQGFDIKESVTVPPAFLGENADGFPKGSELSEMGNGPLFVCQSCVHGQYCPEGSALPPTRSPLIQL